MQLTIEDAENLKIAKFKPSVRVGDRAETNSTCVAFMHTKIIDQYGRTTPPSTRGVRGWVSGIRVSLQD